MTDFEPGERFLDMQGRDLRELPRTGIWAHLGWTLAAIAPGEATLEWETTTDHAFPTHEGGWIVHGGMVTAILDTAMGQATWTLLNRNEVFLTANLHVEFYRPTKPGLVRAEGRVIQKSRRVTFATGELYNSEGKLLAGGRVTNTMLPAR